MSVDIRPWEVGYAHHESWMSGGVEASTQPGTLTGPLSNLKYLGRSGTRSPLVQRLSAALPETADAPAQDHRHFLSPVPTYPR